MINKNPLVSICIPTYIQTKYLKFNLDSILAQEFTDFEVVITDDSPDDTIELFLEDYRIKFDGKLRYFRNTIPKGSPCNWDYCIKQSKGKFVKILHHDDWFSRPDSLSLFVEAIEKSNVNFVFSTSIINKDGGEKYPIVDEKKIVELRENPTYLFFGNIIGAPSATFFRKSSMLTFDPQLKWLVDVEFYIRFLLNDNNFFFINKPLISTLSDGVHQITRECESDAKVQIFENFYLFNKIENELLDKKKAILLLKNLLEIYNIEEQKQLNNFGLSNTMIPYDIKTYLPVLKFKLKIKKLIRILCFSVLGKPLSR